MVLSVVSSSVLVQGRKGGPCPWLAAEEGANGLAGLWLSMALLRLSVLLLLRCRSLAFDSLRLFDTGMALLLDDGLDELDEKLAVTVATAGEAEAGSAAALRLMRSIGLRLLQKERAILSASFFCFVCHSSPHFSVVKISCFLRFVEAVGLVLDEFAVRLRLPLLMAVLAETSYFTR